MFGGKRTTSAVGSSVTSDQVETVIGKDTVFKGSISSNSGLRIDGQMEGDITTTGDIIVGNTGNAKARITARNAIVAGRVSGNMDITEKLELASTATVLGDIKVSTLVVNEGAVFKGACEMRREDDAGLTNEK
jgi:cytoskeletal protein CcmA (bactofilin family)